MDFINQFYPEVGFGGFSDVDGTIAFYSRVNAMVQTDSVAVDIGCGKGSYREDTVPYRLQLRIMKGKCKKVIGIDVDPEAKNNPFLDEFRLIEHDSWPIETNTIDICISDYVLEHLNDPGKFFAECNRILKPDGYLCIRTSNILSYFGMMTRLLPEYSHLTFLKKVKTRQNVIDKFPVLFKCNTVSRIKAQLDLFGFKNVVYGYDAEPGYLNFSRFFYWLGVVHQKHVPGKYKVGIFAFGQKTKDYAPSS